MKLNEFKEIIEEKIKEYPTDQELVGHLLMICLELDFDWETTNHICRFALGIKDNLIEESFVEGRMISNEALDKLYTSL